MTAIYSDLDRIYRRLEEVDKLPKKEADKVRAELKNEVIKVNNRVHLVAKKLGVELV